MVSEGSCDIEDWSNGCWKFSFALTGINYIIHIYYIQIEGSSFLLNCNYISQYNCFYFFIKNSHETLNIDSRKQRWISLNAYFKELVSFRLRIITYFSGSAHSNVHIVQQFYLRDKQTPAVSGFLLYNWLDCVTHVQPCLWDEFFKWTDKQKHYHSSAAEKMELIFCII